MIQFNECRITEDGKHLSISLRISPLSYYTNVYLSKIIIDTNDTFSYAGPSNNPLHTVNIKDNVKSYDYVLDIDGLSDKIFFVYGITKGTPNTDTPCGIRNDICMTIAYNTYLLYTKGMLFINNIQGCFINRELEDYILLTTAFDLCLKTGCYDKAINYWKLITNNNANIKTSSCGCHG